MTDKRPIGFIDSGVITGGLKLMLMLMIAIGGNVQIVRGTMVIIYYLTVVKEALKQLPNEVYPVVPPKVEYSLTPLGVDFIPVIQALGIGQKSSEKNNPYTE